ncbi:MAG: nuclear transport factor 2 family protein [Actinomycetota bacterium]
MYKAAIRAFMRYSVRRLNNGDPSLILRLAHPDATLAFPGENSWATMFRPVEKGRQAHSTHRGLQECEAFAERFVAEGLRFDIEDILVNGGPWRTRIALRVVSFIPGASEDGPDEYNNRAIAVLETRWGRLVSWEDYEDCERVADWDRRREIAPT